MELKEWNKIKWAQTGTLLEIVVIAIQSDSIYRMNRSIKELKSQVSPVNKIDYKSTLGVQADKQHHAARGEQKRPLASKAANIYHAIKGDQHKGRPERSANDHNASQEDERSLVSRTEDYRNYFVSTDAPDVPKDV